jgi:exodeoxyribonuclease III
MSRRSSRTAASAASPKISQANDEDKTESPTEEIKPTKSPPSKGAAKKSKESNKTEKSKATKKSSPKKPKGEAATVTASSDGDEPTKKKAAKKRATKSDSKTSEDASSETTPPKKKTKAADHQRWTERTPLTRHWDPAVSDSYTFTVISWNVAGLRTFIKKNPDALSDLAAKYDADVICLQETKLQEDNLEDKKLGIKEYFEEKLGEYEMHFSCSTVKKGYSGTAMFVRRYAGDGEKKGKKQATLGAFFGKSENKRSEGDKSNKDIPISNLHPVTITKELGLPAHDGEGRTITATFPLFHLTNAYVPNSGQKLDRLSYRTTSWDNDFVSKMQSLEKDRPIIWCGDLNVAYDEKDTWNEGAKHLAKSAGTTPEERESFAKQLSHGYVDAFRALHPEGRGHYSYWSQRAGNREPNKGLRLDYFICSKELMEEKEERKAVVRDSFMVHDQLGSDHCPIVLVSCIRGYLFDLGFVFVSPDLFPLDRFT